MNGRHIVCLVDWFPERGRVKLDAQWAATALLAAYDHELFAPWRPGQESTWKATLDALQAVRSQVVGQVIVDRLEAHRIELRA